MKNLLLILCMLLSVQSFAGEKLKFKEITSFAKELNSEETCLDEFIKVRKRKLSVMIGAPIIATGAAVGGFYAGGYAVVGVMDLFNIAHTWTAMSYVFAGSAVGTAGGVVGSISLLGNTKKTLINSTAMASFIYRAHEGNREAFHKFVTVINEAAGYNKVDEDDLINYFVENDKSGALCNGEISKTLKKRLSKKLATTDQIIDHFLK